MKYNLSEIIEVIKNRRTIYPENFSSRIVQKEVIEKLLTSAIWAPTHGKTQPWRFKVFYETGKIKLSDDLGELYTQKYKNEAFKENKYKKLKNRPLSSSAVIAVCLKRDETEKILEIEEIEAVACAVQNILLTATAYGLGIFWSTPKIIYTPEMNKLLNLNKDDKCLGLLYLGYPSIPWPNGQRRPIEYLTDWIDK